MDDDVCQSSNDQSTAGERTPMTKDEKRFVCGHLEPDRLGQVMSKRRGRLLL
jgi:hypothetical protein